MFLFLKWFLAQATFVSVGGGRCPATHLPNPSKGGGSHVWGAGSTLPGPPMRPWRRDLLVAGPGAEVQRLAEQGLRHLAGNDVGVRPLGQGGPLGRSLKQKKWSSNLAGEREKMVLTFCSGPVQATRRKSW